MGVDFDIARVREGRAPVPIFFRPVVSRPLPWKRGLEPVRTSARTAGDIGANTLALAEDSVAKRAACQCQRRHGVKAR